MTNHQNGAVEAWKKEAKGKGGIPKCAPPNMTTSASALAVRFQGLLCGASHASLPALPLPCACHAGTAESLKVPKRIIVLLACPPSFLSVNDYFIPFFVLLFKLLRKAAVKVP